MNQAGLVHVLTLRLDGGALLCWYNFHLASLITNSCMFILYNDATKGLKLPAVVEQVIPSYALVA